MAARSQFYYGGGPPIYINRGDVETVEAYARDERDLRDYIMIRLPKRIGLRTHEIATLKIENISFQDRSFKVLDSKKKRLYPLPLDILTLELIKEYIEDRTEGIVLLHKSYKKTRQSKPLSNVGIWKTISTIGKEAGVEGFHPRVLRHYFAAHWVYDQHKSMESLRRILRHKNLKVTTDYLNKLIFFEDIQREYEQVQSGPFIQEPPGFEPGTDYTSTPNYQKWCLNCDHEPICKYKFEFCSSEYAATCKHYLPKEQSKPDRFEPSTILKGS